jgi:hypothetical protein
MNPGIKLELQGDIPLAAGGSRDEEKLRVSKLPVSVLFLLLI